MRDFYSIAAKLEAAKFPEDFFGDLDPSAPLDLRVRALSASYRAIATIVHPDHYVGTRREKEAAKALTLLNALKKGAEDALRAGTYGKRVAPPAPPVAHDPIVVTVGKKRYETRERLHQGDLCDLYVCSAGDAGAPLLLKIAQHPRDNDLVEAEARSLRNLTKPVPSDALYQKLLPELVDTFKIKGAKTTRAAVVMPLYAEYRTLTQVMEAYPSGLDFRDMVWMFKRLLLALGYAHRRGALHGAVLPEHMMIHPVDHGGKLIDWCYSVPHGGTIKAIVEARRDWYPPEVLKKLPATPGTDIYMAARCALALLAVGNGVPLPPCDVANAPRAITAFLEGCLIANPARRPDDAWRLHDEFDALLSRLVGPRKYRELAMPEVR